MSGFKVGDRVRYVGGYKPFYASPHPNAQGTVTFVPVEDFPGSHRVTVKWDERLRYCKVTDNRTFNMPKHELELIV